MKNRQRDASSETFTFRGTLAARAAEAMARADRNDPEARAAYARLLVEQSKSFGAYVRQTINTKFKKAG